MNKKQTVPKQTRSILTRQNILNVAFKSFLKVGFKKTNTILIAQNSKVSIGIVYSYFNNKEELLEMWLNNLLERCDDYLYNQFKLTQYEVELSLVISNILEKTTDLFFSSPIIDEKDDIYLVKTLDSFYTKIKQIFIKNCFASMINIRHQNETAETILQLVLSYNRLLKNNDHLNKSILKSCYIKAICSLLDL